MATYIPNATQTTEPVESRTVESAALEFRTLKTSITARIEDVQDGLDAEIVNRVAGDANLQTQNNAQDVRLQAIEAALLAIGEGGLPGTVYVQRLSGTGAQTSFTLNVSVPSSALIDVFINGIYQNKNTFTIVDDVLTFSEAPPAGTDNVEVVVSITIANVETDASLVSFRATDSTVVVRTAQDKLRESVSVKDFGAVGDGVTDDTAAIQAAINYVITNDKRLLLPAGTYSYSGLNNIKTSGFCMVGEGSDVVTLQYTGTGNALSFDAFIAGGPSDPFVNGLLVGGFSVVGATMTKGLYVQGVARSEFFGVKVNGSNGVDGTVGFHFAGTMLSKMTRLHCSYVDGSVPYRGMWFTAGTRAGGSVGACSNNIIESAYPEGNSIGIQISANGGDQNVFLGGSPEACTVYGLLIGTTCRYNTFIGLGFENHNATSQDVNDAGIYSRYINCYSSKHFLISGASRGIHVSGGYFERLEIAPGAQGATVEDVAVNNWATGKGGFFNSGTGTRWANVYDLDAAAYLFKTKARAGIAVGASPFAYTNNEGIPMKILVIGGTVTQVMFTRQGDSWIEENPSASGGGTGTVGTYLLMPGDVITISYSVAPTMNSIPLSGF